MGRGIVDMTGLVVEEEVGFELAQEFALGQAAQEQRLVHVDAPVHQGADGALVRRGAARGDQRGADAHAIGAAAGRVLLQGDLQQVLRQARQELELQLAQPLPDALLAAWQQQHALVAEGPARYRLTLEAGRLADLLQGVASENGK